MGKVYLVGAGPGDPDLITLKGIKAIQEADVILYDRLINEKLLEYSRVSCQLIYCGKKPDHHSLSQQDINFLMVDFALQGKTVTRLKGGDPFIFGRGGEEAVHFSDNDISFEIIPGITSGAAAPAYAGIPVTHRNVSSTVTFASGVTGKDVNVEEYWKNLAAVNGTLCIYMGVKNLPDICSRLIRYGLESTTPATVIQSGTTSHQRSVAGTLDNIAEVSKMIENPAMIVIGDVVRFREKIRWFEEESIPEHLAKI